MLLLVEFLFAALLVVTLYMLYRSGLINYGKSTARGGLEEYWKGKERRQYVRFKDTLVVDYTVHKKPHLKNNCKTVDISEGGVKLLLNEKLAKGDIVGLKISLPGLKAPTEAEGEVAWSEEVAQADESGRRLFYSGVKFSAIKEAAGAKAFLDYVRSLAPTLNI